MADIKHTLTQSGTHHVCPFICTTLKMSVYSVKFITLKITMFNKSPLTYHLNQDTVSLFTRSHIAN